MGVDNSEKSVGNDPRLGTPLAALLFGPSDIGDFALVRVYVWHVILLPGMLSVFLPGTSGRFARTGFPRSLKREARVAGNPFAWPHLPEAHGIDPAGCAWQTTYKTTMADGLSVSFG